MDIRERNLVADPHVTVEIGDETYQAKAATTAGEDRERLWASLVKAFPFLIDHQAKIERVIPVVELTRV